MVTKTVEPIEQQLPQNIEAEFGVLGSIIIDPEAITLVAGFLQVKDFYRDANRMIYETMLSLYELHIPADFITVCDALERNNRLEEVGGPGYITALSNQFPTSGNVEYYAHIVHKAATMRRIAGASGTIAALAYSDVEAKEALEQAAQEIYTISSEQGLVQEDFTADSVIADDVLSRLMSMQGTHGALTGVPTGFKDLDRLTGGLQRSDLIILAARPAIGKSSMALTIARHAAMKAMKNVALFTLEMSKEQLMMRLISMDAKVDLQRLRTNWIEDDEWEQLILSRDRISTNRLWIDDTPSISTIAMYSKLRRLIARQPIDLIIVDYLQLMTVVGGGSSENRVQVLSEITRMLKSFAREFNVPVLALAQLSREVDKRQSKMPQLSDLRESGSLENDADVVLFIYRDEVYNPESERKGMADIIVAKHRNGPVGEVTVGFEGRYTEFRDIDFYTPSEEVYDDVEE